MAPGLLGGGVHIKMTNSPETIVLDHSSTPLGRLEENYLMSYAFLLATSCIEACYHPHLRIEDQQASQTRYKHGSSSDLALHDAAKKARKQDTALKKHGAEPYPSR